MLRCSNDREGGRALPCITHFSSFSPRFCDLRVTPSLVVNEHSRRERYAFRDRNNNSCPSGVSWASTEVEPAMVDLQYTMTVKMNCLPSSGRGLLRTLPRIEDNTVNQSMLFSRVVKVALRPGSWTSRAVHAVSFSVHISAGGGHGAGVGCLQRQGIIKHLRAPRQFCNLQIFHVISNEC